MAGSSSGSDAIPVRWRSGSGSLLAPAATPAHAPAPAPGGWGFSAPAGSRRLVADFEDVIVIGIRDQVEREAARQAIRAAIAAELSTLSGLAPERIGLHTPSAQAPWALLDTPGGTQRVGLAISHDGAMSVAAISPQGAVGIDVTLVMDIPDWEALARDYLGPDVAAALAALPASARAQALARAWSEREARLKCLGRELTEWSADGDRQLAACRCRSLVLPEGYAGVLALPPSPA